ncbi:hypothetical protein FVEG_03568 [Fusarium verticillioides 7600]|uniref:Uncharacterized protein n=1 Tax=Gibberella moniliformis (strain M3125 / FGSC 7600) TaxID=334819 RepID=W7M1T6_GIBM7|nr:hypothetical protein FVEG_03568 [Fusarium verticillioides 7600]EWG41449.1 hypothetical protein FVEG_03568 [Fusarium verticillioides 7600]
MLKLPVVLLASLLIPFEKTPSQIFAKDEVQALPPLAEELDGLSSQYPPRDRLPLLLEAIPACEYMPSIITSRRPKKTPDAEALTPDYGELPRREREKRRMPQQERGIRIPSRSTLDDTLSSQKHRNGALTPSTNPCEAPTGRGKNKRGSLTLLLPLDPLPPGVVSGRTQRGVNLPTEAPRSPDGSLAEMLSSFPFS